VACCLISNVADWQSMLKTVQQVCTILDGMAANGEQRAALAKRSARATTMACCQCALLA